MKISGRRFKNLEEPRVGVSHNQKLLSHADVGIRTGQNNSGASKENQPGDPTSRRDFLRKVALSPMGLAVASNSPNALCEQGVKGSSSSAGNPLKVFCFDLNWVLLKKPTQEFAPAAPQDWAFIGPQAYFDWHKDLGVNIMFCQSYAFGGYAFYPTKLGPVAPGPGRDLLPELFKLSRKAHMPFNAYFCVGADLIMSNMRDSWVVPTSKNEYGHWGYLAPESPWTDLLCARVEEFLRLYPVEWIMFDWLGYGNIEIHGLPLQPAWFVKGPFKEIIGRDMPDDAAKISPQESLKYKREILARQFYRIREAVYKANRETKIYFNVPFRIPAADLWVDHPMLNESDLLFAELESCDNVAVVEWLLKIRKPHQRVMTCLNCAPTSWKKWYERGCDFFGTVVGTPPDFLPDASYAGRLEIVRQAFREMA
jgi:hypothetical protein